MCKGCEVKQVFLSALLAYLMPELGRFRFQTSGTYQTVLNFQLQG